MEMRLFKIMNRTTKPRSTTCNVGESDTLTRWTFTGVGWMMIDVGLVTRQHKGASQGVELEGCVLLYARACFSAVTNRATFCEAFSCLGSTNQPERSPFHGW